MEHVKVESIKVLASGLIRRNEAAKALGKTPKTLCEWAAKGIGPVPKKIGGRVFYVWTEVQEFIESAGP